MNNPTIDGVSREYTLRLTPEAHNVMLGMVEHCLNVRACMGMDEGFKDFDTEEEHDFVKELRALLDADHTGDSTAMVAPAVERQEPAKCAHCDCSTVEACNDWGCGFLESGNGEPEVAVLQSTIAQLQARIAELESGRDAPIAEVEHGPFDDVGAPQWVRVVTLGDYDLEHIPHGTKLYTAPPVPGAVVLPERQSARESFECGCIAQEQFSKGWNACLDATAALNGVRK